MTFKNTGDDRIFLGDDNLYWVHAMMVDEEENEIEGEWKTSFSSLDEAKAFVHGLIVASDYAYYYLLEFNYLAEDGNDSAG